MSEPIRPATDEERALNGALNKLADCFEEHTEEFDIVVTHICVKDARIFSDAAIIKAQGEEIERLKERPEYPADIPKATELAQVRLSIKVLRELLKTARGLCDCSDHNGKALVPCTEANPCCGCSVTQKIDAALAATQEHEG